MVDQADQPRPHDQRAHRRCSVMWTGTLTPDAAFDRYVLKCTIKNFSISGVHVLVERAVESGRPVTLRINGVGVFRGRVAWSEGARLGVAFDDAPERIAELTRDVVQSV